MFFHEIERVVRWAEEVFERELAHLLRLFPHHRYHRRHERDKILFEFHFNNITILQPLSMKKVIGPLTGRLVFKNAEGEILDISNVTGLTLSVNDETIGNAALVVDENGIMTGAISGNGIAAGDLVITANATNDAGNPVSGTATISFHADTTVTEIDVLVD